MIYKRQPLLMEPEVFKANNTHKIKIITPVKVVCLGAMYGIMHLKS